MNDRKTRPEVAVEAVEHPPQGNLGGFRKYLKQDATAGFLVFLVALPLCLGISVACGYPPISGIFTAIVGSIVASVISDSELTIKGPAAGLIVIVLGCVEDFGGDGIKGGFGPADLQAYKLALAVGIAAAILQILFGLLRAGVLGEFFPLAAVHGMLAAIGIIIVAKQIPVALGVDATGEPLELLAEIPSFFREMNPEIAMIGGSSLLIMFLWPWLRKRLGPLGVVPGPMVVLMVAVPLGMMLDLTHHHAYTLFGSHYEVGEEFLVSMPDQMFGMFDEITFPDFSALLMPKAWKWVFLFFVIGNLESLLSAKAIDIIDPWKRKTDLNRDVVAIGIGNVIAGMVGGLPMISEIVRSKANIDNGAQTRFSDLWHGVFLLLCVGLIPTVLHLIPLAALAAMLVYTGFRLAHPAEFAHVKQIGREQLIIFVVTLVAVLATDLLVGIGIGIATKLVFHLSTGLHLRELFKLDVVITQRGEHTVVFTVRKAAVFSNWIALKRQLEGEALGKAKSAVLDVSKAKLVDHSVMEKLHDLRTEFERAGLELDVTGLDFLQQTSSAHSHAARRRGLTPLRRLTVVADAELEETLEQAFIERGATGYTALHCRGAGQRQLKHQSRKVAQVRIEVVIANEACESILDFLREEVMPRYSVSASVETVGVLRPDHFVRRPDESENAGSL